MEKYKVRSELKVVVKMSVRWAGYPDLDIRCREFIDRSLSVDIHGAVHFSFTCSCRHMTPTLSHHPISQRRKCQYPKRPNGKHKTQNTKHKTQNTKTQNTKHKTQNTKHKAQSTYHPYHWVE
ncbi:hypothetical protein EYC84_009661 [Monilinia fructicola]|uniref:Uncharacterized protein n=1 Tax=Monilinia fructicola TaxID=38448 RepID=A0A5M9J9C0_MONFR|nr:hypothetical protein EYC84_009661 [Monilinia fructicola]